MKSKIILTIITVWLIFLSDFYLEFAQNNVKHRIEYHGLLWVALDYYSIVKYGSDDMPKQPIKYTRTKIPKHEQDNNYQK